MASRHLIHAIVMSVAAFGVLAASTYPGAAAAARATSTHEVVMEATSFSPLELTVKLGDSVVWINKDFFPHTATSKAGKFDSGSIDAGKSWTHTPRARGEFDYICSLHPTMKATLLVK